MTMKRSSLTFLFLIRRQLKLAQDSQNRKKFTPVREWDRGKVLYDRWITKQRDERDDEFAPPSSYFK
uniref:Uncharacterized protein n=1 Tax=Loa loa TaxID=7209 RepID=E9L817_LOALO|nr:hypothetical protein [Loa loa]